MITMSNTTSPRFIRGARDLLVSIIREPFTFPGCYARLLVLQDGALLCHACCRKEARRVMSDIRDGYDTGWLPVGATFEAVSAEDSLEECHVRCGHCGEEFGELGA